MPDVGNAMVNSAAASNDDVEAAGSGSFVGSCRRWRWTPASAARAFVFLCFSIATVQWWVGRASHPRRIVGPVDNWVNEMSRPAKGCSLRPPAMETPLEGSDMRFRSPAPALPHSATLSQRLADWRAAPLASHDLWTALNNVTCGSTHVVENRNRLHYELNEAKWREMNATRVAQVRSSLIDELERRESAGDLAFRYTGSRGKRGIVFTAGNADTFERVIVILRMLRSYGTTLPVEVFHFESETPTSAQVFEYDKYDAKVRVVDEGKDEKEGRVKAFHIKGHALIQSEFQEVLYLDSDSIPAKDPTTLFDSPGFKTFGALFWPDFWKDAAENAIWSIIGVQCRDEWTQESGQMLLDKQRHLDALYLVHHMLAVANYPFFFTLSDGDKDLFRYAFLALGKRWAVPKRHVAPASWRDQTFINTNAFCGHTMVQFDTLGEPAFVHANLLKRIVTPIGRGQTWGKTKSLLVPGLSAKDARFALHADHLANVDSSGAGLVPAPSVALRAHALAQRALRTHFHEGFRGNSYVLCIGQTYDFDQLLVVPEGCKQSSAQKWLRQRRPALADSDWNDAQPLRQFETLFYDKLGKAGSAGF